MKVLIINTLKNTFENDGKVVSYCKTTFGTKAEQSENFTGMFVESVTSSVESYDVIKNYAGREVNVDFGFKSSNGKDYKKKITKIDNIEIQ